MRYGLLEFDDLDSVLHDAYKRIWNEGNFCSPRGSYTREYLGYQFCLLNPRARLVFDRDRKWSLPLAIGEFFWHVQGRDNVDALAFYAPIWRQFADGAGRVRGSNYGMRVGFPNKALDSPWHIAKTILKDDPDSRRAIISISDEKDFKNLNSKDLPCFNFVQYILRDGILHAFVSMRSNDVVWGLPYDVFLMTMLQEMMAIELSAKVGRYYHSASSLHVYERHFDLTKRLAESSPAPNYAMPRMGSLDEISVAAEIENEIRIKKIPNVSFDNMDVNPYWKDLLKIIYIYKLSEIKGMPIFLSEIEFDESDIYLEFAKKNVD